MSQLRIRAKDFQEVRLNVESFSSPIFAATSSSQTQTSEQHHPVRTQQPNIRFDVVFRSQKEFENWQTFVRSIQLKLLKGKDPNDVALVTLYWPQRNIVNWQGLIKETDGGAERFQWTPRTVVEIEIVKGLVSRGMTRAWSFGTPFDYIYGGITNTIQDRVPTADMLLTTPLTALGVTGDRPAYQAVNPLDVMTGNANAPVPAQGGSLDSLLGYLAGGR